LFRSELLLTLFIIDAVVFELFCDVLPAVAATDGDLIEREDNVSVGLAAPFNNRVDTFELLEIVNDPTLFVEFIVPLLVE